MNADHPMFINIYKPELNILYYKRDLDMHQRDLDLYSQLKDQTYSFKQILFNKYYN